MVANQQTQVNESMPTVLEKIVKQRRQRLSEEPFEITIENLEPSRRSLKESLRSSETGFIFECKKNSPSRGLLSDNYDAKKIAKRYEAFASGISVLTEPDFFQGSMDDLKAVCENVLQPVLCKDFVIDTRQILQARQQGADVILLMLSVISDEFYQECHAIAEQLELDIITEIHTEEELNRAINLPADIIGINNRNLHTLKTDISTTEKLAAKIPSDRLIISESGISSHQQLKRLAPLVDGFLIGSSMMQSENIEQAIRSLIYGEIKVCGLTTVQDAKLAWDRGASYGGFIFTDKSKRYISKESAIALCEDEYMPKSMPRVGVFMDQDLDTVVETAKALNLKAVQLHGVESDDFIRALSERLAEHCEIWKVISYPDDEQHPCTQSALGKLKNHYLNLGVKRILIDKAKIDLINIKDPITDKSIAQPNTAEHSATVESNMLSSDLVDDPDYILAGHMDAVAINKLRSLSKAAKIAGFDLCSAIETTPGQKDKTKLKNLFSTLQIRTRKNMSLNSNSLLQSAQHYFEGFGGVFVAEILVPALEQLEQAYVDALNDPAFHAELTALLKDFAGRPTPLYKCKNICRDFNVDLYLKREDLLHGGAHKTNQVLAQALLAKRMGKKRIIAETGAGQHGVATAMVCALLDLKAIIYMGEKDVVRQQPNVQRMKLLGAEVISVDAGSASLKDAINEALRDWTSSYEDTHYLLGTVAGPAPYPDMVRQFQQIIGLEAREQIRQQAGQLPDQAIACVGGGSNAIGLFQGFLDDESVKLVGVEAAGKGLDTEEHGATMSRGKIGIFQGCKSRIVQTDEGQITESYSISAGLDYPGVGPQHVALQETGRACYEAVTDDEALDASLLLTRKEGIIPALESSHALAYALKVAKEHPQQVDKLCLLVNLSGRGDKDLATVLEAIGERKNA